ncbi:MAG: fatty acid desaturase family protein [Reyranella sp.]|uniref:fatty acid desaturase family protein n=1 Tax=Reyranella sp. TaxID=1929291 RepID=UPI0025F43400|nr:fatty acid desaturase family protein [Reyranella sp.]MBR2814414.1 fatty acid desaturase family protein [Reyranella sp.]
MNAANDLLSLEEKRRLGAKSNLMGALLVLHAWALIIGSMAIFAWWPNPFTFLLAVMVIGGRQLGLAILMHDAAHGLLFADRRLNEGVGTWLCAYPVFTSLALYRPYHLQHHRFTQQSGDPDLGLSAPFPISRSSLGRKIVRDLTGRTAFLRRGEQIRRGLGPADAPRALRLGRLWQREKGSLLVNAALLIACSIAGYWWLYPVLWLLPLATWYQLVSRIRNIAEHAVVPDNDDPLRNTRTTYADPLTRLVLAPYWVNYHLEHHLFMFVPCWRLPQAHRLLLARGRRAAMEIKPSYLAVLKAATSSAVDGTRGGRSGAAQHI